MRKVRDDAMEPTPPPQNRFDRIERACSRFEAAWREESGPRIEDFLDEVTEEERPELLRELLASTWSSTAAGARS